MVPILSALLRNNSVSSLEQIFVRHLVATIFSIVVLIIVIGKSGNHIIRSTLSKKVQIGFIIQGLIMNLMIVVYFISISLNTPVGEAALFVQIHPITTFLISYLWLKETIDKNKVSSLILALVGIIILLRPWELDSLGRFVVGDFLAMSNGMFYSFFIISGRKSRKTRENIPSFISTSWIMIWAFILGFIFIISLNAIPLPGEINSFNISVFNLPENIIYGIILGLAGSIVPYGLLTIGLPHVESSRAAILLLGEPVGAIIFGLIILNEPITIYYVIGGFILIVAIMMISKPQTNKMA